MDSSNREIERDYTLPPIERIRIMLRNGENLDQISNEREIVYRRVSHDPLSPLPRAGLPFPALDTNFPVYINPYRLAQIRLSRYLGLSTDAWFMIATRSYRIERIT